MKEMISANPDIGLKIIKTLATRLERTTQKLVDTTEESTLLSIRKKKYTNWKD